MARESGFQRAKRKNPSRAKPPELKASPEQLAKLPPALRDNMIKPGEARNPKGVNQYTYRHKFDEAINKLMLGTVTERELAALLHVFPPNFKEVLETTFGAALPTRGELLALRELWSTLQGLEPASGRAISRIWPATLKIEDARATDDAPRQRPLTTELERELRELGERYARQRGKVIDVPAEEVTGESRD